MDPERLHQEVRELRQENRRLRNPMVAWDEMLAGTGVMRARAEMGLRPFLFQSSGGWAWLDAFYRHLPEFDLDPVPFQWNLLWHPNAGREFPESPSVMHVYYPQYGGGVDEDGAWARSRAITEQLEAYVDGGGHIIWTLFEATTATVPFREADNWLRANLARVASVVHVTHEATADRARALYPIDDDKLSVIPHPLLHDVYPDVVTRPNARRLLGLREDDFAILAFGPLRSQKGADRLLQAVDELAPRLDRRIRVVLAGQVIPHEAEYGQRVLELAEQVPGTIALTGHVPDRYVMQLFRAADLVALPYRWSDNSGVISIAMGAGIPVLAPEEPVYADLAEESQLVRVFRTDSEDALREQLAAATTAATPHGSPETAILQRHGADHVSRRLGAEAARLLDGNQ